MKYCCILHGHVCVMCKTEEYETLIGCNEMEPIAKLICVFVFACAKSRFSHDVAHFRGCGGRNSVLLSGIF